MFSQRDAGNERNKSSQFCAEMIGFIKIRLYASVLYVTGIQISHCFGV